MDRSKHGGSAYNINQQAATNNDILRVASMPNTPKSRADSPLQVKSMPSQTHIKEHQVAPMPSVI